MILATRYRDTENWMQILVFVIFAVVYVLGSIVRAKSKKIEEEKEIQTQLPRKPARKPSEGTRTQKQFLKAQRSTAPAQTGRYQRYQRQVQQPHRRIMRPQPSVVAKPVIEREQLSVLQPIIEMPETSRLPLSSVQPKVPELPEFTDETVKKPVDESAGSPSEKPRAKYVPEPLLDYSDTDKLKKAILHYEILGKPLSLRGPSEHIIGL